MHYGFTGVGILGPAMLAGMSACRHLVFLGSLGVILGTWFCFLMCSLSRILDGCHGLSYRNETEGLVNNSPPRKRRMAEHQDGEHGEHHLLHLPSWCIAKNLCSFRRGEMLPIFSFLLLNLVAFMFFCINGCCFN